LRPVIVHNRDLHIALVDSGFFGTWGVFGQSYDESVQALTGAARIIGVYA
jgi:hypothetical protein